MPGNGQPDSAQVAGAMELGSHTRLMEAILAELRSGTLEVSVGDARGREMILDQSPVVGARRAIAYRTGNGFDALPVPTAGVLALAANEGRLGLALVNSGANPIIVYLSDAKRSGVPAIWLSANGGAWDGRFGNLTWTGNVFAVAQTAASTLVGGEI